MSWRSGLVLLLMVLVGPATATAEPRPGEVGRGEDEPGAPVPAASAPASGPAARTRRSPAAELRFDALRIDGQLRAPAVLEVRALSGEQRLTSYRLRHRSFLYRIYQTVESPTLQR